jgi:hypothetical protein
MRGNDTREGPSVPELLEVNIALASLIQDVGASSASARNVAGGRRLYLKYTGGQARYLRDVGGSNEEIRGRINSGSDWALLRDDGCLVIEGRFTLAMDAGREGDRPTLIAARVSGVCPIAASRKEAEDLWQKPGQTIPVRVVVRFEPPGDLGPHAAIAAERYQDVAQSWRKFVALGRGLFLGDGCFAPGVAAEGDDAGNELDVGAPKRLELNFMPLQKVQAIPPTGLDTAGCSSPGDLRHAG